MHRLLTSVALTLGLSVLAGCVASDDAGEETTVSEAALGSSERSPGSVHGVKIKHPGGDGDVRHTCVYMTGSKDRSYGGLVAEMHLNGVYDVFIKLPQKNQVPKFCDGPRLEQEVVDVLKAMHSFNAKRATGTPAMRAWVWERTWLWKDPGGFLADQQQRYVSDMAGIIQHAKREGVAGALEGVGIIETNLTSTDQVRELSVRTAHDINAATGGWMKTHSFLFPGAGMGSWFKGIDRDMTGFYSAMNREVKYFSFIYKFMASQDADPDVVNATLAQFYYGPKGVWKDDNAKRAYIEKTLGFEDLRAMVRWGKKNGHGAHANVVFWGDSGDGLLQMNRANIQLMHELLVEEMGERGHFFDLAMVGEGDEKPNIEAKSILIDRGAAKGVTANPDAFDVWSRWPSPATRY